MPFKFTEENNETTELSEDFVPHWADKKLNGELEVYAQLSSRDGRKLGNAIIYRVFEEAVLPSFLKDQAPLYEIVTDFGHMLRLNTSEIEEAYHPPEYRMKKLHAKLRREYMRNYLAMEWAVVNASK